MKIVRINRVKKKYSHFHFVCPGEIIGCVKHSRLKLHNNSLYHCHNDSPGRVTGDSIKGAINGKKRREELNKLYHLPRELRLPPRNRRFLAWSNLPEIYLSFNGPDK